MVDPTHIQLDIHRQMVLKICIIHPTHNDTCVDVVFLVSFVSKLLPTKSLMSGPSWQCHDSSPVVHRSMVVLLVLLFVWTHPHISSDSCLSIRSPFRPITYWLFHAVIPHVTLLGLSHSHMFNLLNGRVPLLWPEKTQTPAGCIVTLRQKRAGGTVEPRCFYQSCSVPIYVHVCTCMYMYTVTAYTYFTYKIPNT